MNWNIEDYRIFETVSGSQLYGTATLESDTDLRGVVIPPKKVLLNPFMGFEQQEGFEGQDRCLYSLAKFLKLASDANPNVIELLWAPQDSWVVVSPSWHEIIKNTHLFASKKARHTFSGMAISHIHRIKRHRQWSQNPPKKKPERADFGLSGVPVVSGEGLGTAMNMSPTLFTDEVRESMKNEKAFQDANREWNNYQGWMRERHPARRELEAKYGYDTKDAAHLMRVMFEGKELLLTGKITFPRPEADLLKRIRNGCFNYDYILETAENMDADFALWESQSTLPFGPDRQGLEDLYFRVMDDFMSMYY